MIEVEGRQELGNFEFGLYQDDNIPGGRTMPETNRYKDPRGNPVVRMGANFNPYNPELPDIKEAWYIRRTDEASSNPYMFFNVDDEFLWGGTAQITITITYLDMYTDTFSLYYQAFDQTEKVAPVTAVYEVDAVYDDTPTLITTIAPGTTAIPKEGTKKLRRAVFVLNDARLRNDLPVGIGGADFYISSNNDGDEWVHMVELEVNRETYVPEPTPTPTPTATPTPTPTPTATPTPTTARVEGVVWNDLNRNLVREDGEPGVADATLQLLEQASLEERYRTTSDVDGRYIFPVVDPGNYILRVIPPPGYQTALLQDIPLGSLVGGQVVQIDIALNQEPTPTPTPAVVQGRVFADEDNDGEADEGETGLSGVEVKLIRGEPDGGVFATTTTDATGAFAFTSVPDGTYQLVVGRVEGYIPRNGYVVDLAVVRGQTYEVNVPMRAVKEQHRIPGVWQ